MPIRCVERPNRKEPRRFRLSDVERIAKYVAEDGGVSPWTIIAAVAGATGTGYALCKLAYLVESLASLAALIKRVAGLVASLVLIRLFLTRVLAGPLRLIPGAAALVIALIAVMLLIEKTFDAIVTIVKDATFIDEMVDVLSSGCDYVAERYGVAKDKAKEEVGDFKGKWESIGEDLWDDAKDAIEEAFEQGEDLIE